MRILVLGYYDRRNLGDEAYKIVMRTYLPEYQLDFVCIDDINQPLIDQSNGIIVGGGDIINNYFFSKLNPLLKNYLGFKIALSIGIPFPSLITESYFGIFDHVFIRNWEDIRPLQRVIGTSKSHYLPDLTFILDRPLKTVVNIKPKCGIFLVQNLIRYPFVVTDLTKLVKKISNTYDIVFHRFNTSNNPNENDLEISNKIATKAGLSAHNVVDLHTYDPIQMLEQIAKLDFAVCVRFHSHIFCMLAGVPFISVSSTRKTRSLMTTAGLKPYQFDIKLDGYGTPIRSDYDQLRSIYKLARVNRIELIGQIDQFVSYCKMLLDHEQVKSIINISSINTVSDHIRSFMDKYQNHDNAARLMSRMTVGYPDSGYVWGIHEKLNNRIPNSIESSIEYLESVADKFTDKIFGFELFHTRIPIWIDVAEYQSYKTAHRGGWYVAIEKLSKEITKTGIFCDMYVDRTFHWCSDYLTYRGHIPYTIPWCGFIHHTDNTNYSKYNINVLLQNKSFIQSLNTCVCLFTLAPSLTRKLKMMLTNLKIKVQVLTLTHPTVMPYLTFSINKFKHNKSKQLVQIGSWLRNYFSLYALNITSYQKAVLVGSDMGDLLPDSDFDILSMSNYHILNTDEDLESTQLSIYPCRPEPGPIPRLVLDIIEWLSHNPRIKNIIYLNGKLYIEATIKYIENKIIEQIRAMLASVKVINKLDNDSYDELLANSVVFLHLVDSAAVNTVVECIVRNTPILVNKTPGVCDLLGPDYPLYYDEQKIISKDDFDNILTEKNIKKTYKYLELMDKSKFTIDYFVDNLSNIVAELDSDL